MDPDANINGVGEAIEDTSDDPRGDLALEPNDIFPTNHNLPRRLIEELAPIRRWAPEVSFELDVEHDVGSPAHCLLPVGDEEEAERLTKHEVRRLPPALRRVVRSLRFESHRRSTLDLIDDEVRRTAERSAFREIEIPGEIESDWYLPEIHRRRGLEALARDRGFVEALRTRVENIKADGHKARVFGAWPRPLPDLSQFSVPRGSRWDAASWVGLSISSMPEAAPEEVVAALARRIWRRYRGLRRFYRRDRIVGQVLHWGALNSTFALALMGTSPEGFALSVHEVDTVGQQQSISWVQRRTPTVPVGASYDAAFVHIPPPGAEANQIRNRYSGMPVPGRQEIHLEDLGRRGPKKWRRGLFRVLRDVIPRLKPGAELALLLPSSVRKTARLGRFCEWGYEHRPGLLEGVAEVVQEYGFNIIRDLEVVETGPLPQPFFEKRRCSWRLMIAARERTEDTAMDEDTFDDALAVLGVDVV